MEIETSACSLIYQFIVYGIPSAVFSGLLIGMLYRLILIPKQENKMQFKPSIVLAAAGWVSVFVLCWLLLLGVVDKTWLSTFMLVFFFGIALFASVAGQPSSKQNVSKPTITKTEK